MRTLKENLQIAQSHQKKYVNKIRTGRVFEEREIVYLRLQPFRHSSLKINKVNKLKPRFFGP